MRPTAASSHWRRDSSRSTRSSSTRLSRSARGNGGTTELVAEEVHELDLGLYFKNELALMLERAGFEVVAVHGDHKEEAATADDDFVVFVARKPLSVA